MTVALVCVCGEFGGPEVVSLWFLGPCYLQQVRRVLGYRRENDPWYPTVRNYTVVCCCITINHTASSFKQYTSFLKTAWWMRGCQLSSVCCSGSHQAESGLIPTLSSRSPFQFTWLTAEFSSSRLCTLSAPGPSAWEVHGLAALLARPPGGSLLSG